MSAGFPFSLTPPAALRRSVIDPETGNPVITSAPTGAIQQRSQVLPIGRTDSGSLVPAFPKAMFDAVDAARFPGQVLRGEKDVFDPATGHVSDEAMGAAAGIAGTAMTGSLPFGAPKGALRMFGGWNAETADHVALSKAQNLKATGADRQAIWDQTGWFEGPDKHWRYEIPDDLATLGIPKNAPPGYSRLYHDDLGDAYPELWGNMQQSIRESPVTAGRYEAQDGVIHAQGPTFADQRSVALHELQHAIQSQEGFARGANPRSFTATDWEAAGLPMLSESKNAAQAQERWARDQYHRTAGEVEARNVQTRRDFTPEQRRVIPPWETQDVPDAQQIVRPSGTALFSGGHGGAAPAAAAMARPEAPSNTQDPPMSAGIPYGLPTDMSPADLARFFGRAPMGAPQAFTGTSGTVVQPEEAPPPLSLRVPPRAPAPAAPQAAPAMSAPPLPPERHAGLGASPADMPTPGAVPTSGKFPGLASPAPSAAPPGSAAADEGFDFGGALKSFQANGGGDLLVGLGTGLMSTHGVGPGLAAGFQNAQRAEQQRAVTGLAQAELGLKQRKLAQETGALAGNAAIIKRAFPNLSDAEAAAAGSNSGQVTEALKILRDPTHGTGVSRVTVGGNIYELKPGDRPSESNLIGAAEPGVETVRAKAQAAAEGTAAGKPDETFTLIPEAERASLGLPAGSYQRDSKGKVSAVNPTGTTINMGAEKAQDATVGKGYGDYQLDMATKGRNAGSTLNTLALMEQAMQAPGFYSGFGGESAKRANQILGALGVKDAKAASAAEVFDALSNKVVLDGLGGSLGPGISNTDRDYIARTAPTLAQSEQGNRDLIGVARSLAQRQQAVSKLARDYAAGNGGRLDAGFDQALDDFATKNPLFPQARAGEAASAPKEPPQGAPQGARQARDGNWYAPDPSRPGKYLKVQ